MSYDIWVDFNGIEHVRHNGYPIGAITTSLQKFSKEYLDLGDLVVAGDREGNVCDALVIDLSGEEVVTLFLYVDTFTNIED